MTVEFVVVKNSISTFKVTDKKFLRSSKCFFYSFSLRNTAQQLHFFYLNRHHTTEHRQRDTRVALASNFKSKIHSQQNLFAKCMTEMFALNYVLRVSAGP